MEPAQLPLEGQSRQPLSPSFPEARPSDSSLGSEKQFVFCWVCPQRALTPSPPCSIFPALGQHFHHFPTKGEVCFFPSLCVQSTVTCLTSPVIKHLVLAQHGLVVCCLVTMATVHGGGSCVPALLPQRGTEQWQGWNEEPPPCCGVVFVSVEVRLASLLASH